jgi:hypothetical protein
MCFGVQQVAGEAWRFVAAGTGLQRALRADQCAFLFERALSLSPFSLQRGPLMALRNQ